MSDAVDQSPAAAEENEVEPLPLTDDDLLRCVPPAFVDAGYSMDQPSPRVFWPRAADDWRLSVERESIRTPEESYQHRMNVLELPTAGVLSVSTDDLADVDLESFADPLPENEAHALVDFSERQKEKVLREILLKRALDRGWRFVPE